MDLEDRAIQYFFGCLSLEILETTAAVGQDTGFVLSILFYLNGLQNLNWKNRNFRHSPVMTNDWRKSATFLYKVFN